MPVYITKPINNRICIETIKDNKLIKSVDIPIEFLTNPEDIYLDVFGKLYIYKKPFLNCLTTKKSIKLNSSFYFERDTLVYFSDSKKLKKIHLETFDEEDFVTIFPVNINQLFLFKQSIIYFNDTSLVINGVVKNLNFNIKILKISKNFFLILDYENRIHLFNPFLMEIELTINSFKDTILEIHANPCISYVGVSTKDYLTILDLETKKIIKKLNIFMQKYTIHFIENDKLLIEGDKLILYDLTNDAFINLLEDGCKIFYFEFPIYFKNNFIENTDFVEDIENLRSLIIEMKLQFSKEVFQLKEKIEELEDKLNGKNID